MEIEVDRFKFADNEASATDLAQICLGKAGMHMEPLVMYWFNDKRGDEDAHDDELQNRLEVDFERRWKEATVHLEQTFGPAEIGISEAETEFVPLNGVGGAASWVVNKRRLFTAYSHEDRELPWVLVVGAL